MPAVTELPDLETLDAEQLRQAVRQLAQQVKFNQALIDKLTHENALLKRLRFAAQSERYTPEQRSLLEDEIEADLAAVALEIEQLAPGQAPQQRRQALGAACAAAGRVWAQVFTSSLRPGRHRSPRTAPALEHSQDSRPIRANVSSIDSLDAAFIGRRLTFCGPSVSLSGGLSLFSASS